MRIIKLFLGALFFIEIIDEIRYMKTFGTDKEEIIKLGILTTMEIFLLGG